MHNLASVYDAQGRHNEGEKVYTQLQAVQEQKLRPEHPHTLNTMENLVHIYKSQEQHSIAETLFKRVVAAEEEDPGVKHDDT
jgi:Tfp pilus assembly protein PilF